ncbi:MAG: hypothetical protein FJZ01_15615 [Candidatus Sericytochromatia bacterium]|nr:hypothetical protein [Candidatus Tanganyikabacteria bacterium]
MFDEYRTIREQMRSDFKAVRTAFAVMKESLARTQEALETYMQRTEERLGKLIDLAEAQEEWRATVDQRLDALERKAAG